MKFLKKFRKRNLGILTIVLIIVMGALIFSAIVIDPFLKLSAAANKIAAPHEMLFKLEVKYAGSAYYADGEGKIDLNNKLFDGSSYMGIETIKPAFDLKFIQNSFYIKTKSGFGFIDNWYTFNLPDFKNDQNLKDKFDFAFIAKDSNIYHYYLTAKVNQLGNLKFQSLAMDVFDFLGNSFFISTWLS